MCGRRNACSPIPANMGGKFLHCQISPSARAFGRVKVTFLKGATPTLTRPSRSGAHASVGTRGASCHHSLDLASGRSNTGLAATDYCNYRHYRQDVRFADNDCYSYISDCAADALHRKGPGAIRALKDITQAEILIQAVAEVVSRQDDLLEVWEEALGRGEGGPTPFIIGHARLSDQAGVLLRL